MKQETIAVPVELVRELKRLRVEIEPNSFKTLHLDAIRQALEQLPKPKPDMALECIKAFDTEPYTGREAAMRKALRRYRELLGMDRDPELG
jgi:hypothetical protein